MKISDLNQKIILMAKNNTLPEDISITECKKFKPFVKVRAKITPLPGQQSNAYKFTIKNMNFKEPISAVCLKDSDCEDDKIVDDVFEVREQSLKIENGYLTFVGEY